MVAYHKIFVCILWVILFAVIATFWFSVFRFSYDFPFYDDFENIILFVFNYIHADGIWEKSSLLFKQNFEHRVIFAKLLSLLQYLLTGTLSMKWLIILGNLSLLGMLFLFFKYRSKSQLTLLSFFAVTCLLFQVQHYEDTISWATCSLQHAPCIFFSLWSFQLALNRKSHFASGALALIALFTSANGLAAIIIWFAIIYFTSKKRKDIIIPSAILIGITAVHLLTMQIHSGSMGEHAIHNIGSKFILLLSFAGQIVDSNVFNNIYPSVIAGAVFLFPVIIVFFKLIRGRQDEITQMQWFCVAGICALGFVGFLIVFARGNDPDFHGYKMDRYKIYAAFFAVLAVGFYDSFLAGLRFASVVRIGLAGAAFIFCISSYYIYYGPIVQYRSAIAANQPNFLWNKTILYPLIYQDKATASYLTFAENNGLVDLKSNEFLADQANWKETKGTIAVQKLEDSETVSLFNVDWKPDAGSYDAIYAVALDSATVKPQYLFVIDNTYQRAFKQFYTTFKRPVSPGFGCTILKKKMKAGKYNVHLLLIKDGHLKEAYELTKFSV